MRVDRPAVDAGLALFKAGGDFADGVIAFEGHRLGGSILPASIAEPSNWSRRRARRPGCCPLTDQGGILPDGQLCIAWVTVPPVAVRAPSTTYCAPVIAEARSEHKNSTVLAISSGVT